MKILLVNSPWILTDREYGIKSGTRWAAVRKRDSTMPYFPFPYFLASASAFLRKHGFDSHVIDAVAQELSFEQCLQDVIRLKPDLLVIEAFTPSFGTDVEFAKQAKEVTGCKVAFCGAHVTGLPKDALKYSSVDFVALGEYDQPLRDVCRALSEGRDDFENIKGLGFKKAGEIRVHPERSIIENLDDLPIPDRDELPVKKYTEPLSKNYPNARIVSTRGCPFSCIFCVEPILNGRGYRKRTVRLVVDEIEMLKNKYGIREAIFDDTLFTIARAKEIAQEILRRRLKIAWSCWMEWTIQYDDLKYLRDSGCVALKFGIETANPQILKTVGKPAFLGQLKNLVANCKKLGIDSHGSVMLGLPGETRESMQDTINLAFSLGLHSCQLSVATPLPGTPFYEMAMEKGWVISKDWQKYDPLGQCVVEYPNCSKEDILNALSDFKRRKVQQFLRNPWNVARYVWKLFRLQGAKIFLKETSKKVRFALNAVFAKAK